jgi:hypothetical protein
VACEKRNIIYANVNIQIQAYRHTGKQVYGYTGIRVYKHIGMQRKRKERRR